MKYEFRKASIDEKDQIWKILQYGIEKRRNDGSEQWQDGYPNPGNIQSDIVNGYGYVLADGDSIAGYCAILVNDEPAYSYIDGAWLTNGDFVVFHRVAVAEEYTGRGLAREILACIEKFAGDHGIRSIKADTNFDNAAMLNTFGKMGYSYCGEVFFRGAARKAFEKVLPG